MPTIGILIFRLISDLFRTWDTEPEERKVVFGPSEGCGRQISRGVEGASVGS